MGNHMKGCSCRSCRRGMHTNTEGKRLQRKIRSVRRAVKQQLRQGQEPSPTYSIVYTG